MGIIDNVYAPIADLEDTDKELIAYASKRWEGEKLRRIRACGQVLREDTVTRLPGQTTLLHD